MTLLVVLLTPLLLLALAVIWDWRDGRRVRRRPDDLDTAVRTAKATVAVSAGLILFDLGDGS